MNIDRKIYENKYEKKLIENTIKMLSSKWTLYILKDMFLGKKYFSEFQKNRKDLDNKSLTRCLNKMEENSLIEKRVYDNKTEYLLTDVGLSLNRVFYELIVFALDCDLDNSYFNPNEKESIKENYLKILHMD